MHNLSPTAIGLVAALLLAGCAGDGAQDQAASTLQPVAQPGFGAQGEGSFLNVQVLDDQFLPIEGATVLLEPGPTQGLTDGSGGIHIGPLADGDYVVTASRAGYTEAVVVARMPDDADGLVQVMLTATSTDVPYRETQILSMFMECSWAFNAAPAGSGRLPCTVVPLNIVTGQELTSDTSTAQFAIPSPNLASLLWEMTWQQATAAAGDLLVALTDPGASVLPVNGVAGGVDSKLYLRVKNQPPIREMLVPDETATGGSAPFDGNASRAYDILVRGDYANSTTRAVALHLNVRVDNYLTFFYHRPGDFAFTALPEQ